MPDTPRQVALVTGASSGIGLELARLLAADGFDLVMVARNSQQLEQLAEDFRRRHGIAAHVSATDLSQPGAAAALWTELVDRRFVVDILVNNAGTGLYGPFAEQDGAAIERMVTLNVSALTTLTRLALPAMLSRGWGRMLNVASIVAYQPGGPRMAAYYATKSYVLSFSKGLAREVRGSGVSVTALCPGPTHTSFEEKSGVNRTVLYRRGFAMDPLDVARAGYRGMMRKQMVVIPGLATKILAFAGELPPRRIALEANRLLLREKPSSPERH
jgi:short-subunit dehydrogenase